MLKSSMKSTIRVTGCSPLPMIKIEGGEFPSSPSITGKDRIGSRNRNSERKTIRTIMQGDLVSIAKMIEERMISFVKRKKLSTN